jgi:hypothetical protein
MPNSDGQINTRDLATDAITARIVRAGSIEADKIAAGAVEADKIAAGSITTEKLAADAVTADKVAANAIVTDSIVAANVTTAKINDQAVDIQRMLNPVHVDALESDVVGDASLTTTATKIASATFSIPSWVGEVAVMAFAYTQFTNGSGANQGVVSSARIGGLDDGGAQQDAANATTASALHVDERTISAPGSTLEVANYVKTSTGTNGSNQNTVWGFLAGVR